MANSDKNLIITPNIGSSTDDPKIVFSGANSAVSAQNITARVYPTSNGTLSFEGTSGQLFSITNSLTGTIFSVNDVSGIPSITVQDTGLISMAPYSGNVSIGSTSDQGYRLYVGGSLSATSFAGAGTSLTGTAANLSVGYATSSGSATYASSAGSATNATYASSAGYATSAGSATNATSAGSATNATYATSAGSATLATGLNASNYITRRGGSGNYNTDFQNTPAGTMSHQGDDPGSTNNPGNTWWFLDNYRHSNASSYWGTQVAWGWEDNANKLAQRNISGGSWSSWVYYLNSGNYTNYNSYPIIYDSDNTGYYLDLSSTSNSAMRIRGGTLYGSNTSWGEYLYVGTNGSVDINVATIATTNGNLHLDAKNGYVMYLNNYATSSYTIMCQSARSPVFYDYNDTTYYMDPNSTTNLYALTVNQTISGSVSGSAGSATNATYATSAGSTQIWYSQSHPSNYYLVNNWDGTYWSITSNHGAPAKVGYATSAGSATNATYASSSGSATNATYATSAGSVSGSVAYATNAGTSTNVSGGSVSATTGSFSGVVSLTGETSTSAALNISGYNTYGGTGYHTFLSVTNTYGSATNPNKYFRLSSSGTFEIVNSGYTATIFQFDNSGNFTASQNVTAYSDARLKTNIETIQNALNKVLSMRGVSFIKDEQKGIGVIAQEIREVLPEVVLENNDENKTLSVAYGNIVGVLIEAIKEQQDIIDSQEQRLAKLESLLLK